MDELPDHLVAPMENGAAVTPALLRIDIHIDEQPHGLRTPWEIDNLLALQSMEDVVDAGAHLLFGQARIRF